MRSNFTIILLVASIAMVVSYLIFEKSSLVQKPYQLETSQSEEFIEIEIDRVPKNKKGKLCSQYRFIEMQFSGDLGEKLRTVAKCKFEDSPLKNANSELEKIKIPFQHIFTFAPQSGEFTTDLDTKIYVSNHQKEWSKKWKLEKFYFFNTDNDRFEVIQKSLVVDVESLQTRSAKGQ